MWWPTDTHYSTHSHPLQHSPKTTTRPTNNPLLDPLTPTTRPTNTHYTTHSHSLQHSPTTTTQLTNNPLLDPLTPTTRPTNTHYTTHSHPLQHSPTTTTRPTNTHYTAIPAQLVAAIIADVHRGLMWTNAWGSISNEPNITSEVLFKSHNFFNLKKYNYHIDHGNLYK